MEDLFGYLDNLPVNPDGATPHPLFSTHPTSNRKDSDPFYFSRFRPDLESLVPVDTYGCTTAPESGVLFSRFICFITWRTIAKSFASSFRNVYRIAAQGASQITLPEDAIWIEPDRPLRGYRR